ncbi:hypothetical protein CCHR01_03013 [Colletotrichum chrysophilum]|uniref:Uncharacterized protein n=1 Tax=Colletotrichum chrysophilum TaxID=1836956 RepID=A0AAD9ATS5_9PEZI|nr:hypothetical protein CCHR01_03013 [Colletotrichum chrysophilum]
MPRPRRYGAILSPSRVSTPPAVASRLARLNSTLSSQNRAGSSDTASSTIFTLAKVKIELDCQARWARPEQYPVQLGDRGRTGCKTPRARQMRAMYRPSSPVSAVVVGKTSRVERSFLARE